MSSTAKWIAQCFSQEAACSRRSSLSQIDLVNQLSKLSSSPSFLAHQARLNGRSETNLLSVYDTDLEDYTSSRPSEDDQSQGGGPTDEDGRLLTASLSLRRASCDPRLLQEALITPRLRCGSRRSSLATPSTRRGSVLSVPPSALPRRRSLGGPSPLQPSWEASPRQPSLSPCVEDEFKEERFLFSNCDNKSSPSKRTVSSRSDCSSSCSPFLHNENFSKLCASVDTRRSSVGENLQYLHSNITKAERRGSYGEAGQQSVCTTIHSWNIQAAGDNQSKPIAQYSCEENETKSNVPVINLEEPSPEHRTGDPDLHEGFSLWLIQHIRESRSSGHDHPDQGYAKFPEAVSRFTPEQHNFQDGDGTSAPNSEGVARGGDLVYRPSCRGLRRVSLPYRRTAFSSSGCRRVSLHGARAWQTASSRRKASLHTPRLRAPAPSPSPLFHKRSPQRVGAVIGRGGFGTVHIGRYKGEYVAVKKVVPRRSGSCLANERTSLRVGGPHPHLVTILALLAPAPSPTAALLMHYDQESDTVLETEVPLQKAMQEFGLHGSPVIKTPLSIRPADSSRQSFSRRPSLTRLGLENVASLREDRSWLWVVSELCTPATLLSVIHSPVELSIKQKLRYLGELASGLSFLHSRGFVHRDVKPANAFIAYNGALKLGDFGCCRQLGDDMPPVIGTIPYQAPEVLQGSAGCLNSDVFSFGVTAWHLLHRSVPYQGLHPHVVAYNVTRVGLRPDCSWDRDTGQKTEPCLLEALLGSLCRHCWRAQPAHRPSSASLCRSISLLYLTPDALEKHSL